MSVSFLKAYSRNARTKSRPWTDQELADFYRATEILRHAGLNTEYDSGVTDEGDPWFVFIRPENGDVIVHFARIDGQFVAVSSVNQEVYRGDNIREIVDRMLKRHPTLIPQNKNESRFLLHPTAALTAFLAAAFILTIDGVKPTNLKEVLVEAGASSKEKNKLIELQVPITAKADFFKAISSDLTAINYNSAVHGMALIALELGYNDGSKIDLEHSSATAIELTPLVNESQIDTVYLSGINVHHENAAGQQSTRNNGSEEHLFLTKQLVSGFDDNAVDQSSADISDQSESQFKTIQDSGADSSVIQVSASEFWGDGYFLARSNYIPSPAYKPLKIEGLPSLFERDDSEPIEGRSSLIAADFLEGARSGHEESHEGIRSQYGSNSEQVEFEDGNFLLVSVKRFDLNEDIVLLESGSVDITDSSLTVLGSDLANAAHTQPILQPSDKVNDPAKTSSSLFVDETPILGHSFKDPGHILQMTDAIDVVFYNGGDAEVAGFELGKDLLWSFLSPDQLLHAKKTINNEGDLILNFGEVGTLSLMGVIPELTQDLIV